LAAAWHSGSASPPRQLFGDCNWGGGDVHVDHHKATNIDRNFDRNGGQGGQGSSRWEHSVDHRKGVAYRDNATRERFGREQAGAADRRANYRGRDPGAGNRAGVSDRMAGGNPSASDRMNGATVRARPTAPRRRIARRPATGPAPPTAHRPPTATARDSAGGTTASRASATAPARRTTPIAAVPACSPRASIAAAADIRAARGGGGGFGGGRGGGGRR
jgi:hypothetical protein